MSPKVAYWTLIWVIDDYPELTPLAEQSKTRRPEFVTCCNAAISLLARLVYLRTAIAAVLYIQKSARAASLLLGNARALAARVDAV